MIIIPAIDLIDGKCVRLTKGDYASKKIYRDDPLDVALELEDVGIRHLHLIDLDGAKADHPENLTQLERIASRTRLQIEFGGGIKTDGAAKDAFNAGATQIIVGSLAVKNPDLVQSWISSFGSEKVVIGADVKDSKIAVTGWLEKSDLGIEDFVKDFKDRGARYFLSTEVSHDGVLQGPDLDLYQLLKEKFPNIFILASGGVSSVEDLEQLAALGVYGVVVGKAIYEGRVSLKQIADFNL